MSEVFQSGDPVHTGTREAAVTQVHPEGWEGLGRWVRWGVDGS